MLDAHGRAVLTDFGLARPEQESQRLTSDGVVIGTPAYMAPEQAAGQPERIGPWTDLYSVGIVFFEVLTGKLPFEGTPVAVLSKILHEPPAALSRVRPYLDSRLDAILLKALHKEPEGRDRSAEEFSEAVAGLAAAAPTASMLRRLKLRQRQTLPCRNARSPRASWGQIVAGVSGILAAGVGVGILAGGIAETASNPVRAGPGFVLGGGAGPTMVGFGAGVMFVGILTLGWSFWGWTRGRKTGQ